MSFVLNLEFKKANIPKEIKSDFTTDLTSLIRSERWSVWGLENGLTTFTEALTEYLTSRGVEIYTNFNVEDINIR